MGNLHAAGGADAVAVTALTAASLASTLAASATALAASYTALTTASATLTTASATLTAAATAAASLSLSATLIHINILSFDWLGAARRLPFRTDFTPLIITGQWCGKNFFEVENLLFTAFQRCVTNELCTSMEV